MPINANVTNNQITANVGETKIDVSVSGGVGPTGATGPQGPAGSLVMASASVLGGVRIGGGVSIDGNGVISVSTAYAASSHAHGFITASGTITDNAVNAAFVAAPAVVTTNGFLRQGEFGTTSGTICAGNDARLSDARQPLSHSHAAGDITSGTLSASLLPLASASTRGAVRIGTGITIDGAGVISATVSSLDWASITGKPSTFPPTLPTGTAGDVLTYSNGAWTAAAPSGGNPFDQELNTTDSPTFAAMHIASDTITTGGNTLWLKVDSEFTGEPNIVISKDGDGSQPRVFVGVRSDDAFIQGQSLVRIEKETGALGPVACEAVRFADETEQTTAWTGTLSYTSLTDLPELFDGAYSSLTGLPTLGTAAAASTSDFAPSAHNHAASEITSGTLDIARIPVGTSSTTVAAGNDSRFTDSRTPTDGSVTDAKITSGGLSASSINWVAIQPWAANTAYAKGDLVSYLGVAYRRSAQGTSGSTFSAANWQAVTPAEFVGSQITSGTIPVARLGTGSPSASNFLRGDGTFAAAGSTNASDLTTGTLANARLTTRARAAINTYLWSSLR